LPTVVGDAPGSRSLARSCASVVSTCLENGVSDVKAAGAVAVVVVLAFAVVFGTGPATGNVEAAGAVAVVVVLAFAVVFGTGPATGTGVGAGAGDVVVVVVVAERPFAAEGAALTVLIVFVFVAVVLACLRAGPPPAQPMAAWARVPMEPNMFASGPVPWPS